MVNVPWFHLACLPYNQRFLGSIPKHLGRIVVCEHNFPTIKFKLLNCCLHFDKLDVVKAKRDLICFRLKLTNNI